jgi:hypothetical protein
LPPTPSSRMSVDPNSPSKTRRSAKIAALKALVSFRTYIDPTASNAPIKQHDTLIPDVFSAPAISQQAASSAKITYRLPKVTIEEIPDEDGSVRHLRPTESSQPQLLSRTSDSHNVPSRSILAPSSASNHTTHGMPSSEVRDGHLRMAPPMPAAAAALKNLETLLRGEPRGKGGGYKPPAFDPWVLHRLNGMAILLRLYVLERSSFRDKWGAAALQAATALGQGPDCSRNLAILCRQYILDRTVLPINPYGDWNQSLIDDDGVAQDLGIHLQSLGKNITPKKVVEFLSREDVKEKHSITKTIGIHTARRYLRNMGYRFSNPKKGQYCDGHEREDVVWYRQHTFVPLMKTLDKRVVHFDNDGNPEAGPFAVLGPRVIVWWHDESIFYAHDRRRKVWAHKDASAVPYKKGDGPSLMVADFVSADFGWLKAEDGTSSARRMMRPGKNRDGYFTNEDLEEQAIAAMDIVTERWPEYEHVFVYDNASTHLKRPDGSLSARKMPKNTKPWMIEVTRRDPVTKKPMYTPDGKVEKVKVPMADTVFNGKPQALYYLPDHANAGQFKGMRVLLEERGYTNVGSLRYECPGFKCPPGVKGCCCRRLLYTQPDFEHVPSLLETVYKDRGFRLVFLPKFHCELNFIEQCWGYAKRTYRINPESSREDHLEKYTVEDSQSPII